MYEDLSQRCLLCVSGINRNWHVLKKFVKKINSNFHKNPSGGEDLLHKDGLTDMAKLTVVFYNRSANEPTSKWRREEEENKNNKERKLMNEDTLFIRVDPVPDQKQGPGWWQHSCHYRQPHTSQTVKREWNLAGVTTCEENINTPLWV